MGYMVWKVARGSLQTRDSWICVFSGCQIKIASCLTSRTPCEGGVFVVVERARWWVARACVGVVVVEGWKGCFGIVGFEFPSAGVTLSLDPSGKGVLPTGG